MKQTNISSVINIFKTIDDERTGSWHSLIDIILITILAAICDANNYVDVANWGKANEVWLKKYLFLPYGIPSHDTFTTVFKMINPKQLEECFIIWMKKIQRITQCDIIAVDGKVLCGSYDKSDKYAAINMVSAWSALNKATLGQIKTASKSNEITAIPQLLELLNIKSCIITIDAAGCQTEITKKIIEKEADYVIALKGNQPTLHNSAQDKFQELIENKNNSLDFHSTSEKGHGREETRNYYVFNGIDDLEGTEGFDSLSAIGVAERTCKIGDKITHSTRFYILSLILSAEIFGDCVRGHWGVENNLHWCLDVTFNEDSSRIRKGNGAENMSVARRIALNLLKNNKDKKTSIRATRKLAGWNRDYLRKIIGF